VIKETGSSLFMDIINLKKDYSNTYIIVATPDLKVAQETIFIAKTIPVTKLQTIIAV
jgi:hypothetical protein